MAWQELTSLRGRHSRTYQDSDHPQRRAWSGTPAPLHRQSVLDSNVFDTDLDATLQRVNNAQLDGWRVTALDWHFALGQPGDKVSDGWVGFGGRLGAHWLRFRLARVGYLHWPTRDFDDVGGAPTYDRANLTRSAEQLVLPLGDAVTVESRATWTGLWTTPGGGRLDASWRVTGDGLKEEIVVNDAARAWLAANRPPTTPVDETFFGFVFQVDRDDIPVLLRDGVAQPPEADFSDEGGALPFELRDAQARLLAFLPMAAAYVMDAEEERISAGLVRRMWKDPDGNHYLLIGCRVNVLATLPAGDLVFDPTLDSQVAASAADAHEYGDGTYSYVDDLKLQSYTNPTSIGYRCCGFRQPVALPVGAQIESGNAELYVYGSNDDVNADIFTEAADDSYDFATTQDVISRSRSTASVAWVQDDIGGSGTWVTTPSLLSILQEWADRPGRVSGDAVTLLFIGRTNAYKLIWFRAYDNSPSYAPKLHIVYSVTSGQTLQPNGIASAETFGAPSVSGPLSGGGAGPVFDEAVEIHGSEDTVQLLVQGWLTQSEPIQAWRDYAGDDLAQLTADGRLRLGDLDLGTPDAFLESDVEVTLPSNRPRRAWGALGRIAGTITEAINWVVHELELLGSGGVSGLHTALRVRLTQANSGDADEAELRAGDFEASNEGGTSGVPVGQLTGLHAEAGNTSGAYLDRAVGVEGAISNAGDITEAAAFDVAPPVNTGTIDTLYGLRIPDLDEGGENFAIHSGLGPVHLGDYLELKRPAATPDQPATDLIRIYPGSDGKLYARNWSDEEFDLTGGADGEIVPTVQGRLTLSANNPIPTSDITAATTLYFLPYGGNKVTLYNGSSAWAYFDIPSAGVSASVPASTDTNYDVFLYDNSGTLTLELVAWTSDTTRATALVLQDGMYVRSGEATKLYLGTIRTTDTSGQCADSMAKRFVWNRHNQQPRTLYKYDNTVHTYTSPTLRVYNNNAATMKTEFVIGLTERVQTGLNAQLACSSGNQAYTQMVISYDSLTVASTTLGSVSNFQASYIMAGSKGHVDPAPGYHYLNVLEGAYSATYYGVYIQAWVEGEING